eukprot:2152466-Amphidinium_carterae.1
MYSQKSHAMEFAVVIYHLNTNGQDAIDCYSQKSERILQRSTNCIALATGNYYRLLLLQKETHMMLERTHTRFGNLFDRSINDM